MQCPVKSQSQKEKEKSNENLLYYYLLESIHAYSHDRICIYCTGKFIANKVAGFNVF